MNPRMNNRAVTIAGSLLASFMTGLPSPVMAAVTNSTQCLSPVNDAQTRGCAGITTREQCLGARDGRSIEMLMNRRVKDEPCVWCGGQPCTSNGPAVCEPRDWLNGVGTAFANMVSTGPFEIADCLGESITGVECLTPASTGCHSLVDHATCERSRDGRAAHFYDFSDLRIRNQPCVWCGGSYCTNVGGAKCDAKDFLIRGAGSAFATFTAPSYTVATCDGSPAAGQSPVGAPAGTPTTGTPIAGTPTAGTPTVMPTSAPTPNPTKVNASGSSGHSGTSSGHSGSSSGTEDLHSLDSDSGVRSSSLPWWAWALLLFLVLICIVIAVIICMPTKKKRRPAGRSDSRSMQVVREQPQSQQEALVASPVQQTQMCMQPAVMEPMPTAIMPQPVMQTVQVVQTPRMPMQPASFVNANPYMQPVMAQASPSMQQSFMMTGGYSV